MLPIRCSKTTGLFFLVVGLILPRLPIIFSADFLPDIDEAALMNQVQKWLSGVSVPAYFPGQTHNWSGLEMILSVPGLAMFPPSVFSVKVPMLLLFVAAMCFLYLAGVKHMRPLPLVVLLVCIAALPPMLIWSMKFRGGYVPAFFFASFSVMLLDRKTVWPYQMIFVGGALALMFASHFLVATICMLPLVVTLKKSVFTTMHVLFFLLGIFFAWGILQMGTKPNDLFPPDTKHFASGFAMFSAPLHLDVYRFFSGQWLFWYYPKISLFFIGVPLVVLYLFYKMMQTPSRGVLALLSLGAILFYWLLQPFPLRYGVSFLFAGIILIAIRPPNIRGLALLIPAVYLISLPFVVPFFQTHLTDSLNEKVHFESVLKGWGDRQKQYEAVFSEDETLAYLMNVYGKTHYRGKPAYGRFQSDWYDAEFALKDKKPVGLISPAPVIGGQIGQPIGLSQFFYSKINQEDLKKLGFQLKD